MARIPGKRGIVALGDDVPLYRQIYEHFRAAIRNGQLRPGDRLPSARRFAEEFVTARGTVDAAYAMLAGEGYIVSRGPAGTIVSPELGGPAMAKVAAKPCLADSIELPAACSPRPFQMGLPSLDAFPRKIWSHVVARQARELGHRHGLSRSCWLQAAAGEFFMPDILRLLAASPAHRGRS